MASKGPGGKGRGQEAKAGSSSGSSQSSSTEEEERLRRLFLACDRDRDGFIDSQDLLVMCQQLNMEDAVDEIMQQLGADEQGRISFQEFSRCRMQLVNEIEQEKIRETLVLGPGIDLLPQHRRAGSGNWPTDSDNSLGAMPESIDYDSGARDMSPEPTSLYKLIEGHDPDTLQRMMEAADNYTRQGVPNFLEVANSLHLAALSSLRGEILDLSNRLQHLSKEKEVLEKQLSKQQADRLRVQGECEERLEHQTLRYEERITELHSVIAELRKKLERNQINVIREEDELEESDGVQSSKSNDEVSLNGNHTNESQSPSLVDLGNDLNAELSRVVSELESAIGEHKRSTQELQEISEDAGLPGTDAEETGDEINQVTGNMDDFHMTPSPQPPPYTTDVSLFEEEICRLREVNEGLQEQIGRQETELNKTKAQLGSIREERDRLRRRVRELQTRVQSLEASTSPHNSRTSTPTKSPAAAAAAAHAIIDRSLSFNSAEQAPVAKIAELKKLRTSAYDRQVLGADMGTLPNTKVAEHLVQSLQECSNMQEIFQAVYQCGNEISENKIKEFEIEFERLTSKIDNLKSQNDLLTLTLQESKAHCDRVTVLIGKYESNSTAHQLAVSISDQALEAYSVLTSLMETEIGMILANCRASGIGSGVGSDVEDQEEVSLILQRARVNRRTAECMTKQLLHKVDRVAGLQMHSFSPMPWEDLSSASRTASTTSSTGSSADAEFSKMDEQRLRDYIKQLTHERKTIKLSVMDLESVHLDPMAHEPSSSGSQSLDLENAVLMQELMAMKEEKAELKAQTYLLEKEKASLELQLSGKQSQEQAYLVQIEHLKSEVKETQQKLSKDPRYKREDGDATTPTITLAELSSHSGTDIAQDLGEALKREKRLKQRVQELVATLEKLSKNSEIRHQQSAEFVNDLKRANSALVTAFERAKKKNQNKIKKMEMQISIITEKYEEQIHLLKQRIVMLEDETAKLASNETSL